MLTSEQTVRRAPNSLVHLSHTLINTGNTDYDLFNLRMTLDLNNNGITDPGEPVLNVGDTVYLEPGDTLHLVLTGAIPAMVPIDQEAKVFISATTMEQNVQVVNVDTSITTDSAVMPITKSTSNLNPLPGEEVTYTLTMTNIGTAAATGIPVEVDGAPMSVLVARDIIPANTTLVSLIRSPGTTLLYHRAGAPEHTYTSAPPDDLTQVDAVGLGLARMEIGESLTLSFEVVVNDNASGAIPNTGMVHFFDSHGNTSEMSNTVVMNAPLLPPIITYYSDDSYTDVAAAISIGTPLFVQADAAQCNTDTTRIETQIIIITSDLTDDVESFEAIETAPNSGLFRIVPPPPTQDGAINPVMPGNGTLETQQNDTLTARLDGCGSVFVETTLLIDPFGVIFDSKTNEPVAGAVVTLIDVTGQGNSGNPGDEALVFTEEGAAPVVLSRSQPAAWTTRQTIIPAPSTLNTDTTGTFAFPLVGPSLYRLQVTPPAGYTFPSSLPPSLLPPGRVIDASGSYNGTFEVGLSGPVRIDIPLDRDGEGGLFVQKQASARVVELGDFLDYTIRIKNNREAAAGGVSLSDNLPAGFGLERGSVRLDDVKQSEPQGSPGPALQFALGLIPAGETVTLTYRVRVGPGAMQGDGINRARAQSAPPLPQTSNVATAQVEGRDDVFSDRGFIIGKVFLDCNRNRVQDAGEGGIPGVRLYLENGTFAITDSAGKYNFFGVTPQTHVLKLDTASMPPGSKLVSLSNRHAGSVSSRFVDLKKRELHKADFAEGSCSPDVLSAVQARREQSAKWLPETEKGLSTELLLDEERERVINPREQPASGLIEGEKNVPRFAPETPKMPEATTSPVLPSEPTLAGDHVNTSPGQDLHQLLAKLDAKVDFVDLRDGDILPIAQTHVRVKGRAQTLLALVVNGTELPGTRVGRKSADAEGKVQVWEYIGVTLEPGADTLTLIQRDPFGNPRGEKTITATAPDKLGAIKIVVPESGATADGRTPVPITVQLEDDEGLPVTVRTPVTLEASAGRWEVDDLDSLAPGVQVFIEGGSGTFPLLPPYEPGDATIEVSSEVSSGVLYAEAAVSFLPELRPLLAIGVIEGSINVSKPG